MTRRKLARDCLLAFAAAAGALVLQWVLVPWIGRLPFMVIEPVIIFTAAALGRWPATLVLLIGAANAWVALTSPGQSLVGGPSAQWAILAYAVVGALLIFYGGRLHLRNSRTERAEQRLSLAQDETGVGLFELDYTADTAYASPALCQILGQPVMHGSMPLQQWLQALNAGHVAESRRILQAKVAAGELRYERELRVELPDGQQHWLLSRIRLDLDDRGNLAAARGATLDITDRKQLVTELEAAQAQLRQQLDDLNRLHSLGNRLLAMPSLDDALQATLEAVCSFHDTRFGFLRLCESDGTWRMVAHCGLPPEALTRLTGSVNEHPKSVALGGSAVSSAQHVLIDDPNDDDVLLAFRPLARDLGIRALHSTPLIVAGSNRVLGVITVLGMTPQKPGERLRRLTDLCAGQAVALIEREQALALARETQQRFEVALQSSTVAFTILAPVRDGEGRTVDFIWTYANPAAASLIDRPANELVGRRILEVLPHAWDEPGFLQRYVQVSELGCTAEFDTLSRRSGSSRWVHVIASPLNGSVVLWFADITQRREEQQALQDADRRKDEFLATLAHELRNPLAPIRHAVEILNDPSAIDAQRQWCLAVMERQLQHMTLLLDDLLDVSRITRGTLPLRRERCELRQIVDDAVEISRPLMRQREHRLVLELPDEPVFFEADPLRIGQVLGNLLVNAAKYTPPRGEVRLSVMCEGSEIRLAVTDNGSGLKVEDLERVFDMFIQVPSAGGRSQGGLGIGLALARKLMNLHGGSLDAYSDGPGRGCTFLARLPATAIEAAATPLPATSASNPARRPIARRRILVADDNRDIADSLALLLRLEGHEVGVAYDGSEALDHFRRFRPQVALLDMDMPEQSGDGLARVIRREEGGHAVLLIAISGHGEQRDRLGALEAGFNLHLTKPIHAAQLHALLDGIDANA